MRHLVLLRDFVLTLLLVPVVAPLWCLPWRAAATAGRWYGHVGFLMWPAGRRAGMINLRRAYGPSMTRPRARRMVWQVFGSLGQGVAEGIQFARRFKRGQPGWDEIYEAEDLDLEGRLLTDPRPKIFVTGHLGSWEIATMLAGLRAGDEGAAIVRRIDNPFVNAMVRKMRLRRSSQWIEKQGACLEALRRLRAGNDIALLADESAGPRGVFVEFFGRPASTTRMPALLSLMAGTPIVMGTAVRRPGRRTLLMRLAMIEPAGFQGPEAVREITQQIARTFEQWIREDPEQWRWVHWRWRHRPDGCEEAYTRRDLSACFRQPRIRAMPRLPSGARRTLRSPPPSPD